MEIDVMYYFHYISDLKHSGFVSQCTVRTLELCSPYAT